jgi:hypothetical protein
MNEMEGSLFPITLGKFVGGFTQLFEARCVDVEAGLARPDQSWWQHGKECAKGCSEPRGYYFLKNSNGHIFVVGVQLAGSPKTLHTSFKNVCKFMSSAELQEPGSVVWLADVDAKTSVPQQASRLQALIDKQSGNASRTRRTCEGLRYFTASRILLQGRSNVQEMLTQLFPLMQYINLPEGLMAWLDAPSLETLLASVVKSYIPVMKFHEESHTAFITTGALTSIMILLEVACLLPNMTDDLLVCMNSERVEFSVKVVYLLLWCFLAMLLASFVGWISSAMIKLLGLSSVAEQWSVIQGLLQAAEQFVPGVAFMGMMLKLVKGLFDNVQKPISSLFYSFLEGLGLKRTRTMTTAVEKVVSMIDEEQRKTPTAREGQSMKSIAVKNGRLIHALFAVIDGSGAKLFKLPQWQEHIRGVRERLERVYNRSGQVNKGNFVANWQIQMPTLDYMRLIIEETCQLILQLSEILKTRLCRPGPAVAPGMPLQRFPRPGELKVMQEAFSKGAAEAKRRRTK